MGRLRSPSVHELARGSGVRWTTMSAAAEAPQRNSRVVGSDGRLLKWLVLALFVEKASHGYDVVKRYERRFGWLMPRSHPRIYEEIRRVGDAALIAPTQLDGLGSEHGLECRSYDTTVAGVEA